MQSYFERSINDGTLARLAAMLVALGESVEAAQAAFLARHGQSLEALRQLTPAEQAAWNALWLASPEYRRLQN